MTKVGRIAGLYRYPVKSMAGEPLQSAELGWHGVQGDRRLAFLRRGLPGGGFPWLTASKLPALVTYRPERREGEGPDVLPSLVRTPQGRVVALRGEELRQEISTVHGAEVELVQIDNGIFDDGTLSVIGEKTIEAICSAAERAADVRRFRPNIL
ncbi:MAG TPA: MOSC N-terminal beta barrel domain-containing protein, partial [Thermoanaerobaculia bacterium]|nr:MOSC N-terminal beta barrel domain-containing protein [Thermoanaerobaculia bacterium]